ncbi:glycine--tRNA ligase subunit beta [Candidatus Erwinia haradaeae]|uniref:Glycine--tRNA ligase beta subunit n=1 Tax=Candidatus Erwinia haradaeae TaxID=1922217 RepID=A0A803FT25_9GAMM|nr:glycine--tRNA ligase subunit beta [Candidatus Erwinia haradaeae]VFP87483.1 Glycine--tRNA ligase beta subunit [Candidatus Erwinia haradaeae]
MNDQTFLVEIGTEELPPKTLRSLVEAFADNFTKKLDKEGLIHGKVHWFATPRRLALQVEKLSTIQQNHIIKKRGPTIQSSFDSKGKPTQAAKSWAQSCGIQVEQADRLITDHGSWLIYYLKKTKPHVNTLLPTIVEESLFQLPVHKIMRWGASKIYFIRPIHSVILLLGDMLIESNILGVVSRRITYGHRFMGMPYFSINHANQYPQILLTQGKVQANYHSRKALIKKEIQKAATAIGGTVIISDQLLEEVTALVEWPVILTGQFKKKFLCIPTEALMQTMQCHQKYFPVHDKSGKLLSYFIFVTNIESKDPQKIISGNETVLHSRLTDALFFFKKDRDHRLEDYLLHLKNVLFQKDLGTLYDKTQRVKKLANWITIAIGGSVKKTKRAALLSKCDLMTKMVFEFTEIQGFIGMHYARQDGECEEVAIALNEQYQPRFSGDCLPSNLTSYALAIADKMDTIVGIFGVGLYPKNDKDPYALRRATVGVLRIIIEKKLPLDLYSLTQETVRLYKNQLINSNTIDDVIRFVLGRLKSWYQEKGHKIDTLQAVLTCRPTTLVDLDSRINAVTYFRTLKEATSLSAINKRISNILAKTTDLLNKKVNKDLLIEPAEIQLAENVSTLYDILPLYYADFRYQDALIRIASLHEIIDNFFNKVMINSLDNELRINRLTLLSKLHSLFLNIADFSILQDSSVISQRK